MIHARARKGEERSEVPGVSGNLGNLECLGGLNSIRAPVLFPIILGLKVFIPKKLGTGY